MEIPEQWATAIRSAGFGSLSALANEARMSTTHVVSVVCGAASPDADARKNLAAAMRLSPDELDDLIGADAEEAGQGDPAREAMRGAGELDVPFVLPEGSERLSPRQRALVTELVLTFLEADPAQAEREPAS
ncbi:hypothetical protein [Sinomonas sp. P47F7]|uniref:hypothetical protein n=1 Tax=Sinomonas sp. P47F7 TaxID=3410987 RepID=UPI003BF58958